MADISENGMFQVYRMAFGVTGDTLVNNPLFESEIMCAMTLRFANVDYKKFRVELLQQAGFSARVQVNFFILCFKGNFHTSL